jgi:curved DNA-binding protein CbpA
MLKQNGALMENLYETLSVTEDASEDDIRKAFRMLAKQYHPDSGNGDAEQFRRINHAYQVLSRPESRQDYDRSLRNFRSHSGSMDSYVTEYSVDAAQAGRILRDLVRQTNLVRVRFKYKGRKMAELPLGAAALATAAGFVISPIGMLLFNIGMNTVLQMELVNPVADQYEKAVAAHETGKFTEAEAAYLKTLELSEFFVPAQLNLGMLYRQLGENRKAIECYRKVLEVAPFGEMGDLARSNLEALRGY